MDYKNKPNLSGTSLSAYVCTFTDLECTQQASTSAACCFCRQRLRTLLKEPGGLPTPLETLNLLVLPAKASRKLPLLGLLLFPLLTCFALQLACAQGRRVSWAKEERGHKIESFVHAALPPSYMAALMRNGCSSPFFLPQRDLSKKSKLLLLLPGPSQ